MRYAVPPAYVSALDLGQSSDYSALAVLERESVAAPDGRRVGRYTVRHLQRWPLNTPYPKVVDDVKALARRPPLPGTPLAIDGTGVGRPMVDLFRLAETGLRVEGVTVTGGENAHKDLETGYWSVPKKLLAAGLQTVAQAWTTATPGNPSPRPDDPRAFRRLLIAPKLPYARQLAAEIRAFRVKVKAETGHETFEAWRKRDHDDLVFALALAVWAGERFIGEPWDCTVGRDDVSSVLRAPRGVFFTDSLREDDDWGEKDVNGRRGEDPTWGGLLPPGGHW